MRSVLWQGLVLGAVLAACSGSPSGGGMVAMGGSKFSCEDQVDGGEHACTEYEHLPPEDVGPVTASCTNEGGMSGTSCPTTDVLGVCTLSDSVSMDVNGTIVRAKRIIYTGSITAAQAEAECSGVGTWAAN